MCYQSAGIKGPFFPTFGFQSLKSDCETILNQIHMIVLFFSEKTIPHKTTRVSENKSTYKHFVAIEQLLCVVYLYNILHSCIFSKGL